MKIKVQKLTKKEIQTKYGPKTKLGIFDGQKWYDMFASRETAGLKEGDVVEGSVSEREYNGKIYYELKPVSQLDRIEQKLDLLLKSKTESAAVDVLGHCTTKPRVQAAMPTEPPEPPAEMYDDIPF